MKNDNQIYCSECGAIIDINAPKCPSCGFEQVDSHDIYGKSLNDNLVENISEKQIGGIEFAEVESRNSQKLASILNKINDCLGDLGRLIYLYVNLIVASIVIAIFGSFLVAVSPGKNALMVVLFFSAIELVIFITLIFQLKFLGEKLRETEKLNDANLLEYLKTTPKQSN